MTLMRLGESEFIIRMDDYILMSSHNHATEHRLGEGAGQAVGTRPRPRLLVAGLGMGFTLRAALDELPEAAEVVVAELNPVVVEWCRGPLAPLTGAAIDDPRVRVQVKDVAKLISAAAHQGPRYDAIVLDLYQGTHDANTDRDHPFFGRAALERTSQALTAEGVFAVWSEHPDQGFERRLQKVGFAVERLRLPKGAPRHAVYVALKQRKRAARQVRPKSRR